MGIHITGKVPEGAKDYNGDKRNYLVLEDIQVVDDEGNDVLLPFDRRVGIEIQTGGWGDQIVATFTVLVNSINISDVPFKIENGTHPLGTTERPRQW